MNIHEYMTAHRNEDEFDSSELKEPTPTDLAVGSAERLEVYRRRVENGEKLFSDADTTVPVNPTDKHTRRRRAVELLGFDRWSRPTKHQNTRTEQD